MEDTSMKKTYYPPQSAVYDLQARCPLLSGSEQIPFSSTQKNNDNALSRGGYFDENEEEE